MGAIVDECVVGGELVAAESALALVALEMFAVIGAGTGAAVMLDVLVALDIFVSACTNDDPCAPVAAFDMFAGASRSKSRSRSGSQYPYVSWEADPFPPCRLEDQFV